MACTATTMTLVRPRKANRVVGIVGANMETHTVAAMAAALINASRFAHKYFNKIGLGIDFTAPGASGEVEGRSVLMSRQLIHTLIISTMLPMVLKM